MKFVDAALVAIRSPTIEIVGAASAAIESQQMQRG